MEVVAVLKRADSCLCRGTLRVQCICFSLEWRLIWFDGSTIFGGFTLEMDFAWWLVFPSFFILFFFSVLSVAVRNFVVSVGKSCWISVSSFVMKTLKKSHDVYKWAALKHCCIGTSRWIAIVKAYRIGSYRHSGSMECFRLFGLLKECRVCWLFRFLCGV